MMLFGDAVLGCFRVYLPIMLLWIISPARGQDCSAPGENVFEGYRYVFYHGTDGVHRSFSATRTHCQSLGGDMPIITSEAQNNFVASKLRTDGGNYYIGLKDMDQNGQYKWIDGTSPGYLNWDPFLYDWSPPHCAVMRSGNSLSDSSHGLWNRRKCTSQRRHICQIPLGDGCRWHEFGESQYLIKLVPYKGLGDARDTCQQYGGDLAIIKTEEVNAFLKDIIVPSLTSTSQYFCYWIGLERDGWGDFTWLDGTTPGYTDWFTTTEPNDFNSWGCLGFREGPSWYDQLQGSPFPYICERTHALDGTNEASFGGVNYFVSPSWLSRDFSNARTYCQYHGADLALIKSHDVNVFLHERISGVNTLVYFGLTDRDVEGTYKWIDGTPLQYSSWLSPEPNGNTNENCASLDPLSSNFGWIDVSCSEARPFICERHQYVHEKKWSHFGGTLYYVSQSSLTSYTLARSFCRDQGGDLAQPKTQEMNTHLTMLAGGNSFWFGLDRMQDGIFRWIDGTQINEDQFPSWSNYVTTLFENENCIHQQLNDGWGKLPCTSYLRVACAKPPRPRPVPPIPLMAATSTPYGGGLNGPSFLCLLGSEDEDILTLSTRRLFRLTQSIAADSYTAPGQTTVVSPSESPEVKKHTLPASMEGLGFFECSSVTASRMTSVPLGILLSTRDLQPLDGRFTKTVNMGDNITLSVMRPTGEEDGTGARWGLLIDEEDWDNSLIASSSGSLSHTIQSASLSDAGVYVTYMSNMLDQRQFSLIRLIVKECPDGRWNPPLCDQLCDYCYNGGVCHESSGICICPPGFAGANCLQACGMHTFGWDCEYECGTDQYLDQCAGSQICLPDPYGCNCLAGYKGIYCNETCEGGWFGVDCRQECHCDGQADCNDFTGECPADCAQGWSGPACQVPSVCPTGYFGTNCTQKCNCRNGTSCHKDSGYCDEAEGLCEKGYVTDSVEFPSNCITFSGCHSSCSETCHCSGGIDDCNFLTGNCISSICHPRWTGDQCRTDRFEASSKKTNPGVAAFSCSYIVPPGQNVSSDYVKASIGSLSEEHWISHRDSSNASGTSLNNSFNHEYLGQEEPIYCFVGVPGDASTFAFARLPPREFFDLPRFAGTPELVSRGYYHAVIGWRQWDPNSDTGDGPVVRYKIFVRSGADLLSTDEVQSPSSHDGSVSKRSAENATEMIVYNATGLEAGSTYSVQIAAIRDGVNGEGEPGLALTLTTERLPVPPTTPSPSPDSTTSMIKLPGGPTGSSIGPAVGGAVGGIVVILVIIVLVIIVLRRRRNDDKPSKNAYVEDKEASLYFQDTSLDGENDYSRASVLNPDHVDQGLPRSTTRPKPAIAAKPSHRQTLEPDATDGGPGSPSSKPLSTPKPIPVAQFPAYVNRNRHTALFSEEFHDLPAADIYPQTVAQEKINFKKNRYKNILPYDSARVKLAVINNDPHSDYFNASYIPSFENDKAYIASQGPNNASVDDFWRMVWQENVTTIAMVTRLQEGDKIKCRQYWPSKQGDSVMFGKIKVVLELLEPCTGGVKRKMSMEKGDESRTVTQFHFRVWPDKGVPKHTSYLLKFIKEVKDDHGQNPNPLLIHCSAGVGRTGVVISIDSVVAHAKKTGMVDIFNFVTKIRQNRPYMVQTQEQYAFIYGAVLEDLLWRNTLIPIIHFTDHLQDLHASLDEHRRSNMTKEFETLKSICADPPASQTRSGRIADNQNRNRYGNNLPLQRNRVTLDSPDHDYINASYVKGVQCTFLTTQMPLPNTVSDFCSMVINNQPSTIIMLNDKSQDDKSCAQYWQDHGTAQFGSYTVSTLSTSSDDDMTVRQLQVTSDSHASHTVTQYQFHGWPKCISERKSGARSLLSLIRAVKSSTNNERKFSIIVHCLSGVGRTGVFCSAMECIAQIAESDSVDIFQTVKILRADRMQFVQTEEDYAFIYDVIRAYLHTENYEQLPYPVDDHTYGNVETERHTPDPEENPYEVTDPNEAGPGAVALVYGNVDAPDADRPKDQGRPKPKPQEPYLVYENFAFES
ncbi:uncharacterized protein LOC129271138 isoform X2 [Lytechinus pictus]|uniref:uncharacterized protein LOC129271138 isoform X2 n=1 Tax=Lytechinus pictus TaxID=7653 RepID=UPI0030BA29DF